MDLGKGAKTTMKLISHRGNLIGPNIGRENTSDYILEAMHLGYDVEIDVRGIDGVCGLWLGHDEPLYKLEFNFINEYVHRLWIHCKNESALEVMTAYLPNARYFYHQHDDFTLTSWNDVWCYPGKVIHHSKSVAVLPERHMDVSWIHNYCVEHKQGGVCSDYIAQLQKT